MNSLTRRQRDILTLLIKEQQFIKVKAIAAVFSVAERTVRYDLEWIESWLKSKNVRLIKKPQLGVGLDFFDRGFDSRGILKELNQFDQRLLSVAERQFFVTFFLLGQRTETTMRQIAAWLNVCKNTVVTDVDAVDQLLEKDGLRLKRTARLGISLTGPEIRIRSFYLKLILDGLEKKYLTEDDVESLMKEVGADPVLQIIDEVESGLKVIFSDSTKKELYIASKVALHRMVLGKFVEGDAPLEAVDSAYGSIDRLYQSLATVRRMQIPSGEFHYIRRIFKGAKFVNLPGGVKSLIKVDAEAVTFCQNVINDARRYLGLELQNDLELVDGLTTHLAVALHRLRNTLPVFNPLTRQIQFQMPFIWEMSKKIMARYEPMIGTAVPDEEIAYIAMYFGAAFERGISNGFMPRAMVACGSGSATSGLLITRLKIMLPELKLIGPVAADKIGEVLAGEEIDFIITTTPLEVVGKEVTLVNPLLENEDLNRIKTLIFKNTSKKQWQYLSSRAMVDPDGNWTLKDLLPVSSIQLNLECKDWRQAIRRCSQPLIAAGAITEGYFQAMVKAVLDYGPYMVFIPQIALVHAGPGMGVTRECLSLATLKQSLYFGDKNQELVKIVVVFGAFGHQSQALQRLIKIFEKAGNIEVLQNAREYGEIINLSSQ